jgi:hypothetical protein
MGGVEGLLAVLLVLYLVECVHVIPEAAVLLPMRRKSIPPDAGRTGPGFAGRRFVLSNPLPPLSGSFVVTPWTFSVSPDGIEAGQGDQPEEVSSTTTPSAPGFEDVRARGCHVTLGGSRIWTGVSERAAEDLASWLSSLANRSPDGRAREIRTALRQQWDVEVFRERLETARSLARPLLWLCHSVLVSLFLVLPILFLSGLGLVAWPVFLLALVSLVSLVLISLRRLHYRIHGSESAAPRPPLLDLALVPPGAARACDILLRHVLIGLDPLAAARLTVDEVSFEDLARRRAWDLGLYNGDAPDLSLRPVRRWFRREQGMAQLDFLGREGYPPHRLFRPPLPEGPENSAYCPRCHALFVREQGSCTDCPNVVLLALDQGTHDPRTGDRFIDRLETHTPGT